MGKPIPKPVTIEDPFYKEYVKSLPCCVCMSQEPSPPHHMHPPGKGGMALTPCDYYLVPMCGLCHTTYHSGITKVEFANKYRVNLWLEATECLKNYLSGLMPQMYEMKEKIKMLENKLKELGHALD